MGQTARREEIKQRQTAEMGYTAVVLCEHITRKFADADFKPSAEHCIVFHAHRGERVVSKPNYKSTIKVIRAACRGIKRDWPYIDPPPSFDPDQCRVRN